MSSLLKSLTDDDFVYFKFIPFVLRGELMPKHPTDLMNIEGQLSADEIAFRDKVADIGDHRVRPNVGQWHEDAILPVELLPERADLDFLACTWMDIVAARFRPPDTSSRHGRWKLVIRAFARNFGKGPLAMSSIHKGGSEAQKNHWLPLMASDDVIGWFGLTEPAAGSDPSSLITTALS